MLLYQFPKKMTTNENRVNKIYIENENKKLKKNLIKNIIISIIIVIISTQIRVIWAVIICLLIAIYNFLIAFFAYKFGVQYANKNVFTIIYDDKIVHSQPCFLSKKFKKHTISFEDIESCNQDIIGNLEIVLKSDKNYTYESIKNRNIIETVEYKKSKITLKFNDTEPKYYLLNNYAEKIKYNLH